MTFEPPAIAPQRIAIVGGGISGLAAAYLLGCHHNVTLYEAEPRLGGHARTVMAGRRGDQPVDTGFIVFNYANYPHLTRMFHDLDVPVAKSDMSFGVTVDGGKVEYGLSSAKAMAGQWRNLFQPGYLRMWRDLLRFNARAEAVAKSGATIGDLIRELGLGEWFERYYLTPICGAIWSTPTDKIRDFPAEAMVRFFRNHALMNLTGQHQWWTVDGGSIEYVRRLERHLRSVGVTLRPGAAVGTVRRSPGRCEVVTSDGHAEVFDQVIMACHSDQALQLLERPTAHETAVLGAIRYQTNHMVLHRDTAQMPRNRSCWCAWVYKAETRAEQTDIGVTYWMNRLQNIPETDPLFISLNPVTDIPDEMIYDQKMFAHPVFDLPAMDAQEKLRGMQGQNGTWFAGAYTRYGFHEDGFASAVRIVRAMERQTEGMAA